MMFPRNEPWAFPVYFTPLSASCFTRSGSSTRSVWNAIGWPLPLDIVPWISEGETTTSRTLPAARAALKSL